MKRAALLLFAATSALALTPQQTQTTITYGQDVLKAYAADGWNVASDERYDISCLVFRKLPPSGVKDCQLHILGAQAVVEILTRDPVKHLSTVSRLWVGLPSNEQAQRLAQALASEYSAWDKTQAAKDWFKRQGTPRPGIVNGGYNVPCAQFSKRHLPAGIKACYEGPGPADGPTITLLLADGRSFGAGVH